MREYETTIIVQPEISDEGVQEICARVSSVLDKNKAERLGLDDQGKRRLAYEIRRFQKGHYVCLSYLDSGKVVPELERTLRLEESILRFLTVQLDPDVRDIEARKAEAAEAERIRQQKAAERAAREAEEAKARAEAEAEAAAAAAAAPESAPESDSESPEEGDSEQPASFEGAEEDADEEAASDEDEDEEDRS